MKKVADWQIANPNKGAEHGDLSWTNAVLYVGMLDWAELAEREDGNKDYFKWLTRIGSRNGWQPDKRMYDRMIGGTAGCRAECMTGCLNE